MPATTETVVVLMPVFNGARYLSEQIDSILEQEGVDLRLTIIDDMSQDASYEILLNFAARDPRISVVRNPQNMGLIATIGRLLATVQAPFFALADQDDIWDRRKLERSLRALDEDRAVLVYSDVRVCNATGKVTDATYLHSRRIRPITGTDPVPFVFRNPAIGHTIVATKPVADLANDIPIDLVFHEAWILAAACAVGSVTFIDEPLGTYRLHSDNIVGPKRGSIPRRAVELATVKGRLIRRQRTRARALAAVARLHPDLRTASTLFGKNGIRRLTSLTRFAIFISRYGSAIGFRAVLIEVALFPFSPNEAPGVLQRASRETRFPQDRAEDPPKC